MMIRRAASGCAAAAVTARVGSGPPIAHIQRRCLFGQSFEVGEIRAYPREATGSRDAQWARKNSMIPGIIFGYSENGSDRSEKVYVMDSDLRGAVRKRGQSFHNTLFDIVVEGTDVRQRVLPRDFQIHPFRPKAICINWLRYRAHSYPGHLVDIPLKTINEERCPAIKSGGVLLELVRKLTVHANGDVIPDTLIMDLRGLQVGHKIMASDIVLNEGLRLYSRRQGDFPVAKLLGSRTSVEEAAPGAVSGDAKPKAADAKAKPAGGEKKADATPAAAAAKK